jgi:3-keto-disaccharide hydrolase
MTNLFASLRVPLLALAVAAAVSSSGGAQTAGAPATPAAGAGRGSATGSEQGRGTAATPAAQGPAARGGIYPKYEPDDNAGFVPIFDGKTLDGWDGDPTFWRAENGEIIGETTPDKVVKVNNFLIWRAGKVRNFELKVEFRLSGTNSGIQYRSVEMPEVGKWVLKGYQADLDFGNGYTGNLHEERGRMPGHVVLAPRGQVTRLADGPKYKTLATIGDNTLLRGVVNVAGWNQYHIIARGPVMMQILNGQLISAAIDEDTKNAVPEGLLGFQMHVGPPFKIEYRNVLYRQLP